MTDERRPARQAREGPQGAAQGQEARLSYLLSFEETVRRLLQVKMEP
jgi:hypothetical protein